MQARVKKDCCLFRFCIALCWILNVQLCGFSIRDKATVPSLFLLLYFLFLVGDLILSISVGIVFGTARRSPDGLSRERRQAEAGLPRHDREENTVMGSGRGVSRSRARRSVSAVARRCFRL